MFAKRVDRGSAAGSAQGRRLRRALGLLGPFIAVGLAAFFAASSPAQAAAPVTVTFTSTSGQFAGARPGYEACRSPRAVRAADRVAQAARLVVAGALGRSCGTGTFPVTPGQVLGVQAGEGGGDGSPSDSNCNSTSGGQAGVFSQLSGRDGGQGTGCDGGGGGAGGAASFVSLPGGTAVVIAAGGGGGGSGVVSGGAGGTGGSGTNGGGDGPATRAPGALVVASLATLVVAAPTRCPGCDSGGGGGGGGGLNGGNGGGAASGGGGGGGGGAGTDFVSSSISDPVISVSSSAPGADGLVTITYTPADKTMTEVSCSPGSVVLNRSTTCTATVTDTETTDPSTPTGTVSFTSSGAGTFGGSPCTLQGSGMTARCSVTYTPTSRGAGSHTITADYGGDLAGQGHGAHLLSAGSSEPVRIGLRSASIVAKCLPVYVPLGKPATCKATVTDSSGSASAITPSGTVSFALEPLFSGQKVQGTFSGGGQCTLQGSGASAACSVSYTPTAGGGLHEIVVVYNGDQAHSGGPSASRNVSFVIATAAVGAPPGRCDGVAVTILGSARADRLAGTHRRDTIATGSGVDRISAGGGSDLVCAGHGNDRIFGGPGNDRSGTGTRCRWWRWSSARARRLVGAQAQMVGADPQLADTSCMRCSSQCSNHRCGLGGRHEELHLHLLELARAEDEVAGRDLVAKALADLGDPERRLLAGELEVVLEVEEDALGGLGPQVDGRALLLDRPDGRLEHQVEVARLGQVAVGVSPGAWRACARRRLRRGGRRGSAACRCGSRPAGR